MLYLVDTQPVIRHWFLSRSGPTIHPIARFIATEIGEEPENVSIRRQILAHAITAAELTAIEELGLGLAASEPVGSMLAHIQPPLPGCSRTPACAVRAASEDRPYAS